jgi:putative FmdB family regulatory protein
MPIYEYYCKQCKAVHEVVQRIVEPPLESCPVCRSSKVRKLVSRSSFQLKGSGWYATDYAKSSGSNGNGVGKSNGAAAKPAETSSDSGTDSVKPAAPSSDTPAKND